MANIEVTSAALRLLAGLKEISQKELAERTGMGASQVSRYLSGKGGSLEARQLFRLLDALDVDLVVYQFTVEAVLAVDGVLDPRSPEDRRRLNRRIWRSLTNRLPAPQERTASEQRLYELLRKMDDAEDRLKEVRRLLFDLLTGGGKTDGGGDEGGGDG